MTEAIEGGSTQMIGLARPLTAEPYLCRDLISGRVLSAKPNKGNPAIQTGLSILQIGAISVGKEIPDLEDEEVVKTLTDVLMGKGKEEEKPVEEQEGRVYASTEEKRE